LALPTINKGKKTNIAHDEILLSKVVLEKSTIRVTFPDGEYIIDQLRWYTAKYLGLINGKIINRSAVKYWEIV